MFKVALSNGRWKYGFETVAAASEYAGRIYRRSGHIVAIESYKSRKTPA